MNREIKSAAPTLSLQVSFFFPLVRKIDLPGKTENFFHEKESRSVAYTVSAHNVSAHCCGSTYLHFAGALLLLRDNLTTNRLLYCTCGWI